MSNMPRIKFEVLQNRVFVGYIQGRTLAEAVKLAKGRYGRCEVIAPALGKRADRFHGPDSHRTEGRRPCNNTEAGKARIEAIRLEAIAKWKAENA